jgi:MerR family transcriptional regulator/heat shock protein HspR
MPIGTTYQEQRYDGGPDDAKEPSNAAFGEHARRDEQERRRTAVVEEPIREQDPCYVISIAARMVGMHQQTLRYYERVGLIEPSRSRGNIRLYSPADINRLRQIQRLISDLGVNLAGVEVIIRMGQNLRELERELQVLRAELEHCRTHHRQGADGQATRTRR